MFNVGTNLYKKNLLPGILNIIASIVMSFGESKTLQSMNCAARNKSRRHIGRLWKCRTYIYIYIYIGLGRPIS